MSHVVENPILNNIDKSITIIVRALYFVGAFSVVPMMLLVAGGAAARYVFSKPFSGGLELTSFLLLVMVILIIGYTQLAKINVSMGAIVDKFPSRAQLIIDIINFIICFVLSIALTIASIVQGNYIALTGSYSSVLRIPLAPFYYLIAVGWASVCLASLLLVFRSIIKAVSK